jgi:hypothetical protein
MQNTGLAVDTLKELLLAIPGTVTKLAKLGKQAASAAGDELKKIAKEAASEVVDHVVGDIKDKPTEMALEALKERKDSDNAAVALAGTLLDRLG